MTQRLFCWVAIAAGFPFLGSGCQNEGAARFEVSGQVTLKKQPLDQGTIQFSPLDPKQGNGSGALIENGTYRLAKAQGLTPGKYRVMIFSADEKEKTPEIPGESHRLAKERIPENFNVKSKQEIEVKAGQANTFVFEIP